MQIFAASIKSSVILTSAWTTFVLAHQQLKNETVSKGEVDNSPLDIDESEPTVELTDSASEVVKGPFLIPLHREVIPLKVAGKIVTFKTTYSGTLSLGVPAQEFKVVFDTGSGHVIVPAATCQSESCQLHKSYNVSESQTGMKITHRGKPLLPSQTPGNVTIGFGTGIIKGQFARDVICLGSVSEESPDRKGCMNMSVLMAVEMSDHPFKSFVFDGILGLGLPALALSEDFSFFQQMFRSGQVPEAQFGVFLTDESGDGAEMSEIAIGGFNPSRTLESLSWAPVVLANLGHWQINIKAVRVNGVLLDVCKDGTCRAVIDTGTSHLGVPLEAKEALAEMLMVESGDLLDCRLADAPSIEFELVSTNLTVLPENYMRRLPLREDVTVSSIVVTADLNESKHNNVDDDDDDDIDVNANVTRHCSPRLLPVNLPEPMGPKLWILGEPLLMRYYTVYDWGKLQVGFGLANSRRNVHGPEGKGGIGSLPEGVDQVLMQTHLNGDDAMLFQFGQLAFSDVCDGADRAVPGGEPLMWQTEMDEAELL